MSKDMIQDENLYKQGTDIEFIETLLPYLKHKSFIDIGAEKGTFTAFLSSHGLKGTFFEPLPKFEPELKALAEKTSCIFLNYAIDSTDRSADFFTACDHKDNPMDYFSSLHPLNEDKRIVHKQVATVTCRSLNSLLHEGLVSKQLGILKVDTEGNDLNVLKGMSEMQPEVLMCEYFMPGIYSGWEQGHPLGLIEEAKKLGFTHYLAIKRMDEYEFVSLDNPAFIDQQWGNLIFINDDIYNTTKNKLQALIIKKDFAVFNAILHQTQELRKTCTALNEACEALNEACEEKRKVCAVLNEACEERLKIINTLESKLQESKETLSDKWLKLFKHFKFT